MSVRGDLISSRTAWALKKNKSFLTKPTKRGMFRNDPNNISLEIIDPVKVVLDGNCSTGKQTMSAILTALLLLRADIDQNAFSVS